MAESPTVEHVLKDAAQRMKKSVDVFQRDIDAIRTGRASTALVEHLMVDYYGTPTPLIQLATISTPEARLLMIQPWDRQALSAIEREIHRSDLGLTPNNDGTVIRLPIPPLTQERRQELVKQLKRKQEETHVAIRNIRRDDLERFRAMEKEKQISQDQLHRMQEQLQKLTDQQIADADEISARKEAEVMEV